MDVPLRRKSAGPRPRAARTLPKDLRATRPVLPRHIPADPGGDGQAPSAGRGRGRARGAEGEGCWVDVYEQAFLGGRVRRVHGPGEFHGLTVASLITGPSAHVELAAGASTPGRVIPPLRIEVDLGRGSQNRVRWSIRLKKAK